jgi:DNA polymerase elongation subunit (family B)
MEISLFILRISSNLFLIHLSKNPEKYKQHVSQVIAAEQLMKEGAEVHAGKNIRFLFTDAENKRHDRRVKAEQLIEKQTNADTKKYLLLLYASAAGILSFSGYTTESNLQRDHRAQRQKPDTILNQT